MKKIDIHMHYFMKRGFVDQLLRAADKAGIEKICLNALGHPFQHDKHRLVEKAAREHPDRIIPFGFVILGRTLPGFVDELVDRGFKGIKTILPTDNYDSLEFYPVYERVESYRLPMLFHTGIVASIPVRDLRVSSRFMRPITLDAVARSFPKLNIIAAHLGMPWLREAAMLTRIHKNFYVDITGAPENPWYENVGADGLKKLMFWPNAMDKILFGTDVPVNYIVRTTQRFERLMDELGLSKRTLRNIYYRNAARLLKIKM